MKTKFSRFTFPVALVGLFLVVLTALSGCAMLQKLQAAKIIIQTKMEYKDLTYDSIEIDPAIMDLVQNGLKGFIPNPDAVKLVKNLSQGVITTELGHANFDVFLNAHNKTHDTLITLPLTLKDSLRLAPGDNDMHLNAAFPLDMRVFKLNEVRKYGIAGFIDVSLTAGGKSVSQDFSITKEVTPEDVKKLEDIIRDKLLKMLVNDWIGKLGKLLNL